MRVEFEIKLGQRLFESMHTLESSTINVMVLKLQTPRAVFYPGAWTDTKVSHVLHA